MSNMNEIDPRVEALENAGIGDVAQLSALLKQAQASNADAATKDNISQELLTQVKALGEKVNEMANRNFEDLEAQVVARAEEKFLQKFTAETDPAKKAEIERKAIEEFGTDIIEKAFSGSFKKALMNPVASNDPREEFIRELRKNHDLTLMMTAVNGGLERGLVGKRETQFNKEIWRQTAEMLKELGLPGMDTYMKAAADAFDTATSGDGSEWVPTNMSRELVDAIFLPLAVASRFRRITMTSKAFDMPRIEGRARAVNMSQATSLNDYYTHLAEVNAPSSNKVTFTAGKLGVTLPYSYEIDDDAIVPMGEMLLAALRDGIGASIEDAVINGVYGSFAVLDNASVGNELWTTASAAQGRDLWHGIRRQVQLSSATTTDGGTFATSVLRACRKELGRYGVDPKKLLWIVSPNSYNAFLGLTEVLTVDKYGANATILSGEIGKIDGIPIVVSEFVYSTLASTGLYTGAGQTKTIAVLVYVDAYAFGDRNMVTVEQDKSITAQQNILVGSWRGDFQKLQPDAEKTENVVRNIA